MTAIKIHPPIIEAIIHCLKSIIEDGKVADKEVAQILKQNKQFGARDRSMIAESVYDIVRWRLKYINQLEKSLPHLTYYKHIIAVSLLNRNYEIKNWEALEITQKEVEVLQQLIQQPIEDKHIAQSYPKTFYDYCLSQIGAEWYVLSEALNHIPSVFIRANTLKITTQDLYLLLQKESISVTTANVETLSEKLQSKECLQILSKNNLKNSTLYKQGLFEFQDLGSQVIGIFLKEHLNKNIDFSRLNILDKCAGAGGKTLHLSALLQNKGKIFATDYNESRLKNLHERAKQSGCLNIEVLEYKNIKSIKNLDIILIDAPCSGSGTFKRQPDLKYKITTEKIQDYTNIQAGLLQESAKQLSKKGKIIYATCSILPQENQLQINSFLAQHPEFVLEDEIQLLPTNYKGDGFYMACLSKQI